MTSQVALLLAQIRGQRQALTSQALQQASGPPKPDKLGQLPLGNLIMVGDPLLAYKEGVETLAHCHNVNKNALRKVHKGSIYYWIGVAAYQLHDYESATLFMDAAVGEDIKNSGGRTNLPAMLFMTLNGQQPNQAARNLVIEAENLLDSLITDYNKRPGRSTGNLSVQLVRNKLLKTSIKRRGNHHSLCTALISYVLEFNTRLSQLSLVSGVRTMDTFYLHLLKGCVLFESLLKSYAGPQYGRNDTRTLGDILCGDHQVKSKLGISRSFSSKNPQTNKWFTFPEVVKGVGRKATSPIEDTLEVAYRIRNTVGHNLGWDKRLTAGQYERLYHIVGSSCLHTIASLY